MGQVLTFVSGKGGTGKTSMCAAIASCLGAEGKRVLCIDLDVGLRNLDIALGMTEEAVLPFTALVSGEYTLQQLSPHPQIESLFLLTAPICCEPEAVDAAPFRAFIAEAGRAYDFVLLDAPAGVGHLFRLAVAAADLAIVVTGGEKATLRDGARTAELLSPTPAKLIVNRLEPRLFKKMRATVDDIMDEVSLPLLGLVPEDKKVPLSSMTGRLLVTTTRKGAAAACLRIARRLQGTAEPLKLR